MSFSVVPTFTGSHLKTSPMSNNDTAKHLSHTQKVGHVMIDISQ